MTEPSEREATWQVWDSGSDLTPGRWAVATGPMDECGVLVIAYATSRRFAEQIASLLCVQRKSEFLAKLMRNCRDMARNIADNVRLEAEELRATMPERAPGPDHDSFYQTGRIDAADRIEREIMDVFEIALAGPSFRSVLREP